MRQSNETLLFDEKQFVPALDVGENGVGPASLPVLRQPEYSNSRTTEQSRALYYQLLNPSEFVAVASAGVGATAGVVQGDEKYVAVSVSNENFTANNANAIQISNTFKFLALLIGVASSYAVGVINAAQIKDFVFSWKQEKIKLEYGLTLLPLISFVNVVILSCSENLHALSKTPSSADSKDLLKKHPFEACITFLAASADFLITASCVQDVVGADGENVVRDIFAYLLASFAFSQYILLEGKTLVKRMQLGCNYEDKDYLRFLGNATRCQYIRAIFFSNIIPFIGALGFTALGFAECQEILGKWFNNDDLAAIIAAPLGLIYGSMHYALYGYQTKEFIADSYAKNLSFLRFLTPLHNNISVLIKYGVPVIAVLGALSDGILVGMSVAAANQLLFGDNLSILPVGILFGFFGTIQNFLVEGEALLKFSFGEVEHEKDEAGKSHYRYRQFFEDIIQIGILMLFRELIEIMIIPDSATPQDEDREVVLGSYLFSALISLLFYCIRELYRARRNASLDVNEYSDLKRMFPVDKESKDNDNDYLQKRWYLASHRLTYPSYARILSQLIFQLITPVGVGFLLEWGLRNRLQDDSMTANSALVNAEIIAPFFAGLLTIMMKRLTNFAFRRNCNCHNKDNDEQIYMGAYDDDDMKYLFNKIFPDKEHGNSDRYLGNLITTQKRNEQGVVDPLYVDENRFIKKVQEEIDNMKSKLDAQKPLLFPSAKELRWRIAMEKVLSETKLELKPISQGNYFFDSLSQIFEGKSFHIDGQPIPLTCEKIREICAAEQQKDNGIEAFNDSIRNLLIPREYGVQNLCEKLSDEKKGDFQLHIIEIKETGDTLTEGHFLINSKEEKMAAPKDVDYQSDQMAHLVKFQTGSMSYPVYMPLVRGSLLPSQAQVLKDRKDDVESTRISFDDIISQALVADKLRVLPKPHGLIPVSPFLGCWALFWLDHSDLKKKKIYCLDPANTRILQQFSQEQKCDLPPVLPQKIDVIDSGPWVVARTQSCCSLNAQVSAMQARKHHHVFFRGSCPKTNQDVRVVDVYSWSGMPQRFG